MPTKAEIQANAATLIDEFQTPRMQASMKATQAGQATAVQNDPDKEQAAISKLGLTQTQANMLAKNPIHRKSLLEVAYGDSVGQLQEYQDLLAGEANFRETEEAFQGGAPSGTKMKVLEDALRNKNDVGMQTLGQSELFKSAGVGGYGALSQSLAQRGLEMQDRYGSFVNQLDRVGGFLSDTHNVVASQYKTLIEESRRAEDQYNAVQGSIAKHEQAMDIMERRYKLDAEAKKLTSSLKTQEKTNKSIADSKKIGGYDFGNYAIDENWGYSVNAIYKAVPHFTEGQESGEIDAYIQSKADNSPLTGEMFMKAAEDNGIPVRLLLAMSQQESGLGTSNIANNDNNLGGITWTGSNGEKGSPRPADEGGYYVKFSSVADGLDVMAKNVANRKMDDTLADDLIAQFNAGEITEDEVQQSIKDNLPIDEREAARIAFNDGASQDMKDRDRVRSVTDDEGFMDSLVVMREEGWGKQSDEEMLRIIKDASAGELGKELTDAQAQSVLDAVKNQ